MTLIASPSDPARWLLYQRGQPDQLMRGVEDRLQGGAEQIAVWRFGLAGAHHSPRRSISLVGSDHRHAKMGIHYACPRTKSQDFTLIPSQTLQNTILPKREWYIKINGLNENHGQRANVLFDLENIQEKSEEMMI